VTSLPTAKARGVSRLVCDLMVETTEVERYLNDLAQHKGWVNKYIVKVVHLLRERADGHDDDKYKDPLKRIYSKNFDALCKTTFRSPEYNKIVGSEEFQEAFKIHTKNNRHHPQHFENGVEDMNLIDIIEMLCDWKAASDRTGRKQSVKEGMELNYEKYHIDGIARKWIENTLEDLGWNTKD
jgi:hypothetical protein